MKRKKKKFKPLKMLEVINVTKGKRQIRKFDDFYKKSVKKAKKDA